MDPNNYVKEGIIPSMVSKNPKYSYSFSTDILYKYLNEFLYLKIFEKKK